ncbi:MAG: 50S ribosomal protein L1 [Candidatus Hydrogenedens sp.]|jgi:large subunit ribosomal protein L1|nr:50S ribosomal protein L1 [Candidatus Hydrogenedens sp.]
MAHHSKRVAGNRGKVDRNQFYTLTESIALTKENATAKFDETVELAFLLGVDPRHADQMVRGSVALPHGTGKTVRVVVFCDQEDQIAAATEAGAEEAGGEELVSKIQGGWTDFDAAVATPAMMRFVGRLGKILGPRGLMPSPKAGSVTADVGKAVEEIKAGKIEYRVDKFSNIHVPVGKASFDASMLEENARSVIEAILKARPSACKGTYLKGLAMSSTMGPGMRMDPAAITAQYK